MDRSHLKIVDPVDRQPEHGVTSAGLSPMDPPDAFQPPSLESVAAEELHPFLRRLRVEHIPLLQELDRVEEAIRTAREAGFDAEIDRVMMRFFGFFDGEVVPHFRREEAGLFALLRQRLISSGEHSRGRVATTAVDVMLADHLAAVQFAAVSLNLIRLGSVLPDERSAAMTISAGLREAEKLVELLRLHVFREDNIVFAAAHRLISAAELDEIAKV